MQQTAVYFKSAYIALTYLCNTIKWRSHRSPKPPSTFTSWSNPPECCPKHWPAKWASQLLNLTDVTATWEQNEQLTSLSNCSITSTGRVLREKWLLRHCVRLPKKVYSSPRSIFDTWVWFFRRNPKAGIPGQISVHNCRQRHRARLHCRQHMELQGLWQRLIDMSTQVWSLACQAQKPVF